MLKTILQGVNNKNTLIKRMISNNQQAKKFQDLVFENTAVKELRVEENEGNKVHMVGNYHYSKVMPEPLANPSYVAISEAAAGELGLTKESFEGQEDYIIGNLVPETSIPIANCYVGHQFGNLAGQLGDGRAATLGDVRTDDGHLWEIQLKGSGRTPYSRFADGRAVLRSSVREYIGSEYMHFLGVPTTRALALVISTDTVERDPKYNGNVIQERCAVLARMAPTILRFGSFQINLKQEKQNFDNKMINELFDYTIKQFYPHLEGTDKAYVSMLKEVANRTAETVSLWQCFGFCHGVMNTDNMSILGLTMDYGPFGFMEHYDKFHICNTSDNWGRYAFSEQPAMAKWNLVKLIQSAKLAMSDEDYKEIESYLEEQYDAKYDEYFYGKMAQKLGFETYDDDVKTLILNLLEVMDFARADFTKTFLALEDYRPNRESDCTFKILMNLSPAFSGWLATFKPKFPVNVIKEVMGNPQKKASLMFQLGFIPTAFFEDQVSRGEVHQEYMQKGEEAANAEITQRWKDWLLFYKNQLAEKEVDRKARKKLMQKSNAAFVIRNYLMQKAIELAEKDDYSEVEKLYSLSSDPFNRKNLFELPEYHQIPPKWARNLTVSCSS